VRQTEEQRGREEEQPFVAHLIELRNRLIRSIIVIGLVFVALSFKANELYAYLAGPLTRHMPPGGQMIAIGVASPFLAPLKLALFVSFFCRFPTSFIRPGRSSPQDFIPMKDGLPCRYSSPASSFFIREWPLPISLFFH